MILSLPDITRPQRGVLARLPEGYDARALAELARHCAPSTLLHIARDDKSAALLGAMLGFWAPHLEVLNLPAWDCLPYDRAAPQVEVMGQRIATLADISQPHAPRLVLTTAAGLLQKTLPLHALRKAVIELAVGASFDIDKLREILAAQGYRATSTVREMGEFAVRGGIVDIFPPANDVPVRLDMIGDEIERLRTFDSITQITTGNCGSVILRPINEIIFNQTTIANFHTEWRELFGAVSRPTPLYEAVSAGRYTAGVEHWLGLFWPKLATIFDWLPQSVVTFDADAWQEIERLQRNIDSMYAARKGIYEAALDAAKRRGRDDAVGTALPAPPAPREKLYLSTAEIEENLATRPVFTLDATNDAASAAAAAISANNTSGNVLNGAVPLHAFTAARATAKDMQSAIEMTTEFIAQCHADNKRVVIACVSEGSAARLATLLNAHGIDAVVPVETWEKAQKLAPRVLASTILGISHGFAAHDVVLLTEADILGAKLGRKARPSRSAQAFQLELETLSIGDFVVHREHGIGRYEGLETLQSLGALHDCVKLTYADNDRLYVPVENLEVLTRHGAAEGGAVLDKLGGAAWQARKARVKKRLRDMAESLIKLAALRQLRSAEPALAPESVYQEFAARFQWNETEDQERAIAEVMADLGSGKPMDRLICGDVGFGKTEVALRAAFIAAQSAMQVAVIAPTTLLARQHYRTFVSRFAGFPVRIGNISRLVSAVEANKVKEGLRDGSVNIVIGTHALLSKDIAFKNLGLVIVDEEQHFGVKQKEKLKTMRAEVHVLTLSATPIPRTLQLALAGVRELSLITTPPADRLAVHTALLPWDPIALREALMREHARGGQSFCVCPRLEDLDGLSQDLAEIVPELRVARAHGRLSASDLENIMTGFDAGQYDILLATNIIESGLDLPNANTLIIHRADMFGLSQLYQLRGRVGRAKQRGYALFTWQNDSVVTPTAQRRLEVIRSLDHLGAGFQLASHDMDIRGAGNILGEEQSGHIREVGVELYQQMLDEAIADVKAQGQGQDREESWSPQINVGLPVLIPEKYISDLDVRLGFYRRLADAHKTDNTDKIDNQVSRNDTAKAVDNKPVSNNVVESIAVEMIDRFGALPGEVENLLAVVGLKALCLRAHIARLDVGAKGAVIAFHNDTCPYAGALIEWISKHAATLRLRPDGKMLVIKNFDDVKTRLRDIGAVLNKLVDIAQQA